MSNASNYLEEQVGTHLLRTATWAKSTTIYVALFTTLPAEDGTGGVEVTGGSYARVQHDAGDANWSGPSGGSGAFSNIGSIQFAAPTANWGTVVGFGLYDASTAGNYLIGNTLTGGSLVVNSGDPAPAFGAGDLVVNFA